MAIRIKSKWSKTSSKTKTSEDIASALSFIAWKLSLIPGCGQLYNGKYLKAFSFFYAEYLLVNVLK